VGRIDRHILKAHVLEAVVRPETTLVGAQLRNQSCDRIDAPGFGELDNFPEGGLGTLLPQIDCTRRFARVAIFPKPNSRRSAVTSVRPSTSAVAAKKRSAGSGCSSGNSWAIVPGLGKRERIDCLGVKWPLLGSETQRFNDLPIDRCIAIVEGEEKWN